MEAVLRGRLASLSLGHKVWLLTGALIRLMLDRLIPTDGFQSSG